MMKNEKKEIIKELIKDYFERVFGKDTVIQASDLDPNRRLGFKSFASGSVAGHPAWEDYIVWKNKEIYLREQLNICNHIITPQSHKFKAIMR